MIKWQLPEIFLFEGRTIRYGVCGSGSPVVLVHGTPWSSFNWRFLIESLSERFAVYYYDLLGYGQSEKFAGDISLGVQNQVLDGLLDHWGLSQPAIIGHDFGGATVLRTNLLNERAFRKIVLIDPVAISPWGSPFFRHVRMHEAAFSGVPDYIHDAIVRAYVKTAAFQPIDEEVLNTIIAPWAEGDGKAAFYRQIAQADSAYTDEVQVLYPHISVPVMILWGYEDVWIPRDQGQALHELIPGSTLHLIRDTGHLVIEERPEDLFKEVCPFLQNEIGT